jgi:hypothetical protein
MNYKRSAVTVVALLIVGSALTLGFASSPAMAASFSIDDSEITTDKGQLSDLTVSIDSTVDYSGAEVAPGSTEVELQVKRPNPDNGNDNSYKTIETQTKDLDGTSGDGTIYSFTNVDVTSAIGGGIFNANSDGGDVTTELQFRLLVTPTGDVTGGNGENIFSTEGDTVNFTINNRAFDGNAGGENGTLNANGK